MNFDIDKILEDMTSAVKAIVKEDIGEAEDYGKDILENQKDALANLAKARLSGEISEEILEQELAREKTAAEVEFLTLKVMSKATAQKAVNTAFDIFLKAVKIAVDIAL